MDNAQVGSRLAALRKNRGLSQRELADRAEMTSSAISAIEKGKVSPSISTLHKIVSGLSISLSDFFTHAHFD